MPNYINRKGYVVNKAEVDSSIINNIKCKLTFTPKVIGVGNGNVLPEPIHHYLEDSNYLIIPPRTGSDILGPVESKVSVHNTSLKFLGSLKSNQVDVYNLLESHIDNNGGGIFSCSTGFGKTFLALKYLTHLNLKTLIISASINQVDLMNQWVSQIEKFIPEAKIGTIRGKVKDTINKDVIVSTISSLSRKTFKSSDFDGIGLVIIDECFAPWQKILTDIGYLSILSIHIAVEDGATINVLSYNEVTRNVEYKRVNKTYEKCSDHLVHLEFDNTSLDCTKNHLLYTINKTWVAVENLKVGDTLYIPQAKNFVILRSVDTYYVKSKVYDLEVNDNHNYILDGGILAHNCHHISSATHSKVMYKIGGSPYILGLSATPERQDGLTDILKLWTGDIFHQSKMVVKGLPVNIHTYKLNSIKYKDYYLPNGKLMYSRMINQLITIEHRNIFIINIILDILQKEPNRQILIVSERIDHVNKLNEMFGIQCKLKGLELSHSTYIGTTMKTAQKELSMKSQLIFSTSQSFGEGIDKSSLDTIVLTTPKKHVKENKDKKIHSSISFVQIIGRIFRKAHTIYNPLIVDIWDQHSIYKIQGYSRKSYYKDIMNKNSINLTHNIYLDGDQIVHNIDNMKNNDNISDDGEEIKLLEDLIL